MSVLFLQPVLFAAKSLFNLNADNKKSPAELPEKNSAKDKVCGI